MVDVQRPSRSPYYSKFIERKGSPELKDMKREAIKMYKNERTHVFDSSHPQRSKHTRHNQYVMKSPQV
jgi:hypothetical protein